VDEFAAFVVFGSLVVVGILLAIGRWYPGSGAEQVDWRLTRSPEVEAELEIDDVDQMIEAQNVRRRRTGRRDITEADIREQVAADQRWRDELRRRAARGTAPPGSEDELGVRGPGGASPAGFEDEFRGRAAGGTSPAGSEDDLRGRGAAGTSPAGSDD
jgi:hypothetical protein